MRLTRSTMAAVAGLWLVLAIGVGSSGVQLRLPPVALPASVLGLVGGLVASYRGEGVE